MKWKKGNSLRWNNIQLVPIQHNRAEFALEVRKQFEAFQPEHLAVEYPDTLKEKILFGINRLPLLSVVHYREKDGSFTYLLLEPTDGQVEAIRLALSSGLPISFIDRDTESYPFDINPQPDSYAVSRIGHRAFYQAYLNNYHDARFPEDTLREKTMAYHLHRLNKTDQRVLFVCGLAHLKGILTQIEQTQIQVIGRRKREDIGVAHLHEDSSREIMTEMPYFAAAYETARSGSSEGTLDRLGVNHRLLKLAQKRHWKKNRDELTPDQMRILNKFAGNYALLKGRLVPGFYELLIAARGVADDNFAYVVWEKGSEYPWQTDNPGIPVLRLKGEDLFLGHVRIKFHRQLKRTRRRLISVPIGKKRRERDSDQWKSEFKGHSICSYPPEDVIVEGYGDVIKKRAMEIKSEENFRIEPFTCSLEGGLDIRETIRKWGRGKIYVKAEHPMTGKVGSVVVIFDPDIPDTEGKDIFPWCVTWLGEHDQESDMAFYSTPVGRVMDGPGISRCQYGGFMLTYPPMRVYDIWKDPYFDHARNKPERLLMAAIDYAQEKHIVYVAASPPSGWCRSMAARYGKRIIYLPIGTFSPATLKRIRQFHILDGHPVRTYAHHYI